MRPLPWCYHLSAFSLARPAEFNSNHRADAVECAIMAVLCLASMDRRSGPEHAGVIAGDSQIPELASYTATFSMHSVA